MVARRGASSNATPTRALYQPCSHSPMLCAAYRLTCLAMQPDTQKLLTVDSDWTSKHQPRVATSAQSSQASRGKHISTMPAPEPSLCSASAAALRAACTCASPLLSRNSDFQSRTRQARCRKACMILLNSLLPAWAGTVCSLLDVRAAASSVQGQLQRLLAPRALTCRTACETLMSPCRATADRCRCCGPCNLRA